jgi:hypothetical protein
LKISARTLLTLQAGRDASKRGAKGEKGERGARGERGLPGARGPQGKPGLAAAQITAWKIDRQRYRAVPFYSDGKPGPAIELRDLFQHFLNEVGQSDR